MVSGPVRECDAGELLPINLAYVTSCRWVDPYGIGTLHNIALRLQAVGSRFAETFHLVAIIADDDAEEYASAWARAEIWPRHLTIPTADEGGVIVERTLDSLTVGIPSRSWRELSRRRGETLKRFRERKAKCKREYEQRILAVLIPARVDLILADSYLPIFGPVLLDHYRNRILNVHPAISQPGDPARLPGRTPTRDTYTRAAFGFVIVDDKRLVGIPIGRPLKVVFGNEVRDAIRVPPIRETGVTVHVITEDVDAGPIVLCERYTIADDELTPEAIRDRSYRIKLGLVPQALEAYVHRPEVRAFIRDGRRVGRHQNYRSRRKPVPRGMPSSGSLLAKPVLSTRLD